MSEYELDASVRRAAFDFLTSVTSVHGDTLPWKLLTSGFAYGGDRVPLIGASGIWKPRILPSMPISVATAPPHPTRPARYNDGVDDRGRLSYRYRGTDPTHPDNVGLREAQRRGTPLIYFFGIEKGIYLPTWPVFVVDDDPSALTFYVSVDDGAIISDRSKLVEEPEIRDGRRRYVTGVTVRRLHQQSFRARVLRAYRQRCAVCRLKHVTLLDAAHIIPDSDPRGEPVVSNGLALCKIHHAAFDQHIIGIRPDFVVEVRRDVLDEIDGPMLKYGLQQTNGERLYLPSRAQDRPALGLVEERYEAFKRPR